MAYDRAERAAVRRQKAAAYGTHEVFAVPALNSYPLTKDRRPDRTRVQAAWDYLHVAANRTKLGEPVAAAAERRIRAFARAHFPDLALAGAATHKGWATDEVYLAPDLKAWPLTYRRQPDAGLLQKAWADVHSVQWEARLDDAAFAEAEQRLLAWAHAQALPVTPPKRQPRAVML